jgi:hypothetical protein
MLKYFIYYKYRICNKDYSILYDSDSDSYIHMGTVMVMIVWQLDLQQPVQSVLSALKL